MNVTKHSRFKSIAIDYVAFILVIGMTNAITHVVLQTSGVDIVRIANEVPAYIAAWTSLIFTVLLNKDIFNGQSLGKRICNLCVVNASDGKISEPWKCLARNLTLIIAPMEVIMLLVNGEKRIGDIITRTSVTPSVEEFYIVYERDRKLRLQRWFVLLVCWSVLFGLVLVYNRVNAVS